MKILVVDDDGPSRRMLQRWVEQWGYQVVAAPSGEAAWELLQSGEYPIVITDWVMPGMDGVELIRRLRASEGPDYIYAMLLTARGGTEDLVEGMEAGADDFVVKPFDGEELRVRLRAGERVVLLERALIDQNRALREARRELERRVDERTAALAETNTALQREMTEREQASQALETAQEQLLEAEREKKRFYREVIRAVTEDRFHLLDAAELAVEGERVLEMALTGAGAYARLRREVGEIARSAGMSEDQANDLVLAAGEAATNAIKHAKGIRCAVYLCDDRIAVRVSDRGPGISPEALPASVLKPGFSTTVSLGMGYTLMLAMVNRVYLATGPEGTTVLLEKWLRPEQHEEMPLLAALERF